MRTNSEKNMPHYMYSVNSIKIASKEASYQQVSLSYKLEILPPWKPAYGALHIEGS